MGSEIFQSFDRTLRRIYWSRLIDDQIRTVQRENMRASLVISPYTGLSILADGEREFDEDCDDVRRAAVEGAA